ncbi:MAG TPA: efflux RND transporter periplasmic adaptor subunit, partial [Vicinamibacteria bacterium]|nr:efflux RND transporter periplasmic adaptor subunit [Vicinamibacteria bacterium]
MSLVGLVLMAGLALLAGAACRREEVDAPGAAAVARPQYRCPMHPTYVADRPGQCPICGMDLVPTRASPPPTGARRVLYYRSPMDPKVRSDQPARDSMGMDFVPVYADELEGEGSSVAGRATLALTPERRQFLGVQTAEVREAPLGRTIRTVGRLAVDERRVHHVHVKYEGYVERLDVDYTGARVRKGDHLLAIYSPELVATQQEYLLAWRAQKELGESGIPSVAQGGVDLLRAARRRLELWDIRDEDIAALEKKGVVTRTLDLHAETGGYVLMKNVVMGQRVTPQDTLFDIVDLSHLWVLADVYASDLPSIREGMVGEVRVSYLPGRAWRGRVTWISPVMEEKTRTVKVRLEVDNTGDDLKPDMFVDVYLKVGEGTGLVVPESAVIDTGDRKIVFLDHGDGRLEPRAVTLGVKQGDAYPVASGLAAGDRVVTAANFLIDSESSLKAAIASLGAP